MTLDSSSKTILIAPLNWGLGHATRCIPIIKALQENNFTPIIASDGIALELLKKEFPYIQTLQLPSYQIEYAKNGGRINTDAIDNSAGVDCSDHEVNIKIALIQAMRDKKITLEEIWSGTFRTKGMDELNAMRNTNQYPYRRIHGFPEYR